MVVRAFRALVRGIGWLLTPAIVAATSAGALWLGAKVGSRFASADLALATAVGSAIGAGAAVFFFWVLSLRHARHHARRSTRRVAPAAEPTGSPRGEEASPTPAAAITAPAPVDEAAD